MWLSVASVKVNFKGFDAKQWGRFLTVWKGKEMPFLPCRFVCVDRIMIPNALKSSQSVH